MNELIPVLLIMGGVVSVACSFALITLGNRIEEFSPGDETSRTRGITSPVESTKIAVVLFWIMFLPGAWALLQEEVVLVIIGITDLFAICLFMLTALVFSFSVLSAMSRRKNESNTALSGVNGPHPSVNGSSSPAPGEPVANTIPQKNSLLKTFDPEPEKK